MKNRRKLLNYRNIYDVKGSDDYFLNAMIEILNYHIKNNETYANILKLENFDCSELKTMDDLYKIPALPTLFVKNNELFTKPKQSMISKSTTSGTSGKKSIVGIDLNTGSYMVRIAMRTMNHFKLFSWRPTNHVILGYQPAKGNETGITKTTFASTLVTVPLKRVYALKRTKEGYQLDVDTLISSLQKFDQQGFPVRLMGLPAFHYLLLTTMKERGIKLNLHPKSYLFLGGGWKQYYFENADKNDLFKLAQEVLGVPDNHCKDFFSAVEHPIMCVDCKNHHFHVPVYTRVIIRDVETLEPVGYGKPGIVNFVSPLMKSMPLNSIMTDDLAILYEGETCGCGNTAPYFKLLGRAGLQELKTCAVTASSFLPK